MTVTKDKLKTKSQSVAVTRGEEDRYGPIEKTELVHTVWLFRFEQTSDKRHHQMRRRATICTSSSHSAIGHGSWSSIRD